MQLFPTKLNLNDVAKHAAFNGKLSYDEILWVLNSSQEEAQTIFHVANDIRAKEVGNAVHLRGLIEFSNICIRKCQYCGLACTNKNIQRYRMKLEDILATAESAKSLGYQSLVLQSGEDPYYNADRIAQVVSRIKESTGLAITLSAGEYSYHDYKKIKEAGVDRYLLRFETSDPIIYRALHPDSTLAERLECLNNLKELGFQTGTGFMVGLPNETPEILANNLLLLVKFDVDMVGIGPFLANPDTPLAAQANGSLLTTLKAVALIRILLRNVHIPATTAMGTLDPRGREQALMAGANVIMPNVSPMKFRELYKLYPNKMCITADQGRAAAEALVHSLGREIALNKGHSLKQGFNNE